MDANGLSYRTLMERCCLELNIDPTQVERIRKLPDVRLRSDEDVGRFNTFESLEICLNRINGL
jgi:hypothetical protein